MKKGWSNFNKNFMATFLSWEGSESLWYIVYANCYTSRTHIPRIWLLWTRVWDRNDQMQVFLKGQTRMKAVQLMLDTLSPNEAGCSVLPPCMSCRTACHHPGYPTPETGKNTFACRSMLWRSGDTPLADPGLCSEFKLKLLFLAPLGALTPHVCPKALPLQKQTILTTFLGFEAQCATWIGAVRFQDGTCGKSVFQL